MGSLFRMAIILEACIGLQSAWAQQSPADDATGAPNAAVAPARRPVSPSPPPTPTVMERARAIPEQARKAASENFGELHDATAPAIENALGAAREAGNDLGDFAAGTQETIRNSHPVDTAAALVRDPAARSAAAARVRQDVRDTVETSRDVANQAERDIRDMGVRDTAEQAARDARRIGGAARRSRDNYFEVGTNAITPAQLSGCIASCQGLNPGHTVEASCSPLVNANYRDLRAAGRNWVYQSQTSAATRCGNDPTQAPAQMTRMRNTIATHCSDPAYQSKINQVLYGVQTTCAQRFETLARRQPSPAVAERPAGTAEDDTGSSNGAAAPAPVAPIAPTPALSPAPTPAPRTPVAPAPVVAATTPTDRTSRNAAACNGLKASRLPELLGNKDPQLRSIGTAAQQSALQTLYIGETGWTDSGRSRVCAQVAHFRNSFNRHGCGGAIGTGDAGFVPSEGLMAKVALSELLACQCAGQDRLAVRNYRREHGGNLSGIPADIAPKSSQYGGRVRVDLALNCQQLAATQVAALAQNGGSSRSCAAQLNSSAGGSAISDQLEAIRTLTSSPTHCRSSSGSGTPSGTAPSTR